MRWFDAIDVHDVTLKESVRRVESIVADAVGKFRSTPRDYSAVWPAICNGYVRVASVSVIERWIGTLG